MPYYHQSLALGSCSQALSYSQKWALVAMLGLSQSTDKNGQAIHPPTHPPTHSPSRPSYGLCSELAQCWALGQARCGPARNLIGEIHEAVVSAVSAVWAVIRHGEPEKMPNSGTESQGRLLARSGIDAETEGDRGKGVPSRGKQICKGWS